MIKPPLLPEEKELFTSKEFLQKQKIAEERINKHLYRISWIQEKTFFLGSALIIFTLFAFACHLIFS